MNSLRHKQMERQRHFDMQAAFKIKFPQLFSAQWHNVGFAVFSKEEGVSVLFFCLFGPILQLDFRYSMYRVFFHWASP